MLVVEDGTGKVDANSYATVADLDAYAANRLSELPATVAAREALLLKATDYLEGLRYVGNRATLEQALEWPRVGAHLFDFELAENAVPIRLQFAQMQLAIEAQTVELNANVQASIKGAVLEESVEGAVSVKYAAPQAHSSGSSVGSTPDGTVLTRVATLLRPLLAHVGQVRVRRG